MLSMNTLVPHSKSRGFTLIELMVVMVLLGLLATIAVTTIGGGNQSRELMNEANRLHALLRMASEEAIYSNTEIGVVLEPGAYEFVEYDEQNKNWTNTEHMALRPHVLPEWITMDFEREGEERELATADNDGDLLESNVKKPEFMLLSSGEVDGFRIGLQIGSDSSSRIEIISTDSDEIIFSDAEAVQ